jgi:type I restriction enzyme S subunit
MSNATIHIETEKQLIPVLRFKEFEGSWEKDILKTRIDSIDSGWSPQCEGYPALNEEWGVLKTTAVVWEGFNQNANKKLPDTLEPRPNLQVVEEDILITRAGPTSRVGVTVFLNEVRSKLMLSDKLIRLKVNDSTSSLFLSISLGNRDAQKQLVSKSSGLAESQTNISQKILLNTKLLFPQFPEQQKIASFLSAVDEKIQQLTKKKELLEDYKKGVMQQLFSGQLRFKDENGEDYPDWEEKRLGEIGKTFNGLTGKTKVDFGEGKPYIQYMQIFRGSKIKPDEFGFVKLNENEKQSRAQFGDAFFTTSSETPKEIGTASVLLDEIEELYLNSFCFGYRPDNLELIVPQFLQFLLRSEIFRRKIISLAQGSTRYNMSKVQLMKLIVAIPCSEEQQKIATYLSGIDTKIEAITNQITQTQTFKKGLLQQMFV